MTESTVTGDGFGTMVRIVGGKDVKPTTTQDHREVAQGIMDSLTISGNMTPKRAALVNDITEALAEAYARGGDFMREHSTRLMLDLVVRLGGVVEFKEGEHERDPMLLVIEQGPGVYRFRALSREEAKKLAGLP